MPRIIGTYELELHQHVNQLIGTMSHTVVDAGSAEGYYAVGLLFRNPRIKVQAFEMEENARRALRELATLNGVQDRLEIHGKCDANSLAQVLRAGPVDLLLMDVEGFERELLDPEKLPELRHQLILVEVHDIYVPNLSQLLCQRFQITHRIEAIPSRARTPDDIPIWFYRCLAKTSVRLAESMMWERPPGADWMLLVPLAQPANAKAEQ